MKHRIIEILGLSGRRRIEIILPRRPVGAVLAPPRAHAPPGQPGPFTLAYAWSLRALGLKEPITHTVRRWQRTEPLLFILLAATLQGILAGHFWW